MENIDDFLLQLFVAEAGEQLERINEIILGLEDYPEDPEGIPKLFRYIHSLKGSAGLAGLTVLKETLHQAESMLDGIRKGRTKMDPEKLSLLSRFTDVVQEYIESGDFGNLGAISAWKEIFEGYAPGLAPPGREKMEAVLILDETEKAEIAQWQEDGKAVYSLELQLKNDSELQGASALIYIKYLSDFGVIFKTAPVLEELRKRDFSTFKVVLLTEKPVTPEIERKFLSYPLYDVTKITIRQWIHRPGESRSRSFLESSIRVDVGKLDCLMNHFSDLLQISGGLAQHYRPELPDLLLWNQIGEGIQALERITGELRLEIMQLRMIPAHQLFSRFPKMVRELARQKGQIVELSFLGEDAEVEKQVADKIVDSLAHLIRNAVVHGIESGAEREASGKPRTGKIILGATRRTDQIIFSIRDDGRGLHYEKIMAAAAKNGFIEPDRVLTEPEINKVIFLPGFSTADEVSDLSGRGVGLDVVANSLRELNGEIEVDSKPGYGTEFRLKIPFQPIKDNGCELQVTGCQTIT